MEHKIITDLAYTYIGLVTTMTKHYVDEGVPLLFNSSIRAEGIDFSNPIYLDNEFAEDNKNRKHRTGDVITVHTGDIGTSAIIPDSLDGSLGFATIVTRIHDKNVLLPEYLCAYLNYGGGKEQLYKYARDIRNNLNLKDFNKLIVPVPDLYRQKEIVKNVNTLNKIVCQRKQELAFFDDLIKARFVELFVGKDYPLVALDDLSLGKGEYGAQSASTEYVPGRPRYVRITDINDDGSLNDDVVSSANVEDDEQYKLGYGDFMFARMGATVGKTYAYKTGNQIFAGYLIRYRLNLEKIMPEYLYAYTRLDDYKNWVLLNQSGAAQPGINAKKYGSLQIPVAPLTEQKAFEDFVKQVDKSKVAVQKSLNETQKLFDSLMQEYFG